MGHSVFTWILPVVTALTFVLTAFQIKANESDDLLLSMDGLKCTSCGVRCESVCGSRYFKTCCLNYVKKRNYPSIERSSQRNAPPSIPAQSKGVNEMLMFERWKNPIANVYWKNSVLRKFLNTNHDKPSAKEIDHHSALQKLDGSKDLHHSIQLQKTDRTQ